MKELLPVPYFHVVFTISDLLRPLALRNKRVVYDILFRAASETLLEVSRRRLNAEVGALAVLHTWGQKLTDHPHLHWIVTSGGLSLDGKNWVHGRADYFLPVPVLSKVFRGKFLDYLGAAFKQGKLVFPGEIAKLAEPEAFGRLLRTAAQKPWVVYAKKPFGRPEQVLCYLGRYTHRVAISNSRLLRLEDDRVTFSYKDYANENETKEMTLPATEFLRRFLLHVLPKNFKRIRMYGIWGNRAKKRKIALCRELIAASGEAKAAEIIRAPGLLVRGPDPKCPECGSEELVFVSRFSYQEVPRLDTS